jgi:hypothetical protein
MSTLSLGIMLTMHCGGGSARLADWRNPNEYPRHPPTLLVQPVEDNNADVDAARFYHQTMLDNGGTSAYLATSGSTHAVSPASFGVVVSWIENLLGANKTAVVRVSD